MSVTSVVEVREWLVALLLADTALMALLAADGGEFAGVYDEAAPEGAPFDYIVVGGTAESDGPKWIGSGGLDGVEDVRIFTRPLAGERPGAAKAKIIYRELHRLLHRRPELEIANGLVLRRPRLALITSVREQDRFTTGLPCRFTFHVANP